MGVHLPLRGVIHTYRLCSSYQLSDVFLVFDIYCMLTSGFHVHLLIRTLTEISSSDLQT